MFKINITCFHKSLCLFEWNWECWVLASLFWCLNVHWSHNDRSPGQKSLSIQDGRWKCKISIEHCKISIEHWISYDCTTAQSGGWLETVNWPQLDRCREAIVDFSIAMTVWQCRLQADWVMSLQNILHITCLWVCITEWSSAKIDSGKCHFQKFYVLSKSSCYVDNLKSHPLSNYGKWEQRKCHFQNICKSSCCVESHPLYV